MAWYTSRNTYIAFGLLLPIAGMAYIATRTSNSTVLILSAIALFLCYPLTSLGIYMWATGNGSKWISGINLEKYTDEQRRSITSAFGIAFAIGALILCTGLTAFLWNVMTGAILTVISIVMIMLPIIRVTICKSPLKPFNGISANKIAAMICISAVMIVPYCCLTTANVPVSNKIEIAMSETSITIRTVFFDHTIKYDDINELYKTDNFDRGSRISGSATSSLCSGKWNNSQYGDYELAIDPRVNKVISIKSNDNWFVFNLQTEEKTVALYDELVKRIS